MDLNSSHGQNFSDSNSNRQRGTNGYFPRWNLAYTSITKWPRLTSPVEPDIASRLMWDVRKTSPVAQVVKNCLPVHSCPRPRDVGLIPKLGRSPGGRNGSPFQYSCLENPMDRGAWWATVCGIAKRWTRLITHAWKMLWEGHMTSVVFFPQIHDLSQFIWKHQWSLSGGTCYKIADQYSSNCPDDEVAFTMLISQFWSLCHV